MAPSEIAVESLDGLNTPKTPSTRPSSDADESTSNGGSTNGGKSRRRRRNNNRGNRRSKNNAANGETKVPLKRSHSDEEAAAAAKAAAKRPKVEIDDKSKTLVLAAGKKTETDPTANAERLEKMCGAVRTLLECIGEDADRPGLLDSPARYAKALLFLTKGYQQTPREIINNAIWDDEGHNHHGMVIVRDIEIYSLCEHHLVPFTGKMHIGYIPTTRVLGLSKLARIAEVYARRLQIQERLTKEVANAIMDVLKPQGVAVVMEAKHFCMVMRGVEKTSATTITSSVLGCFERSTKTRNEFLSLLRLDKPI
ncbi:hypothetical protein jhhlp_008673 [Lomentospora prolificans]|uniref:GTP cyclohydrolase 1 n=1 Tax=Lomentospora prolificans TaxID=41688 RepID=A0A2N3MYQ5_9PEZI|nr:hypothetical protein jhhlp_008673 [Lomentospora prolificans]